uniref:hypothetical protein n=1 Tax=Paraprevotella clara TaxID=454154 RepID=UPI004025DF43
LRKTSRKRTEILHPNTGKPHRKIYLDTPDGQNPAVIPYTSTLLTLTPSQKPCAENTVWSTGRKPESFSTLHFVRHGLRENPAFLTYRHDTDKKRSHAHPELSN